MKVRCTLIMKLRRTTQIVDYMYQRGQLLEHEHEAVICEQTLNDKATCLVDIVSHKSVDCYKSFLASLNCTDQKYLHLLLEEKGMLMLL